MWQWRFVYNRSPYCCPPPVLCLDHSLMVLQNYTDDAMPENEEAPADEAPGKAEDKDDDKDKDEDEE